jgi:Acyl-CoA thioesterase C-terminal domain/Acyl-CoA thioesterase N-terminal domain
VPPAFYRQLTPGRFLATPVTAGPWDPSHQHGGPPAALLARAIELTRPRPDRYLARITLDILGPLPLGDLDVAAHLVRPGRSVELLEAEITAHGRPVMRANAWRIRAAPPDLPSRGVESSSPESPDPPVPGPEGFPTAEVDGQRAPSWASGYVGSIEWRFVSGHFLLPGPCVAWTKMRVPLVEDEEPTPLQRALVVADSGNGLSNVLDIRSWLFVNPDLSVHLARLPQGEWICVDAATTIPEGGVGLARSTLSDERGPFGYGAQSLLVAAR